MPENHAPLTFADFTREAPMMLDAIVSAIASVENVDGLEVLHVDPDDLFPAPASHANRNPLWRWSGVETWFAAYEGRQPDTERSLVLGAINGALQVRHSLRGANDRPPARLDRAR